MSNTYSEAWNELFLKNMDNDKTQKEVDVLLEVFPREQFPRVLDLCCGLGRHSIALAKAGYQVTAIDNNPGLIEAAKANASEAGAEVNFICDDIMNLSSEIGEFDLCIIMWQSFGYFSSEKNVELLEKVNSTLRPGGSLFLDVYNADFVKKEEAEKTFQFNDIEVRQTNKMEDGRLKVSLEYSNGSFDQFDWQVFSPSELEDFVTEANFQSVRTFEDFEDSTIEGNAKRMQISCFSF